jgi:hypothetical protein
VSPQGSPAAPVTARHSPSSQTSPGAQVRPQSPQLAASTRRSVQIVPQHASPGQQALVSSAQALPKVQAGPQVPSDDGGVT